MPKTTIKDWTVSELKKECKRRRAAGENIRPYSRLRKQELFDMCAKPGTLAKARKGKPLPAVPRKRKGTKKLPKTPSKSRKPRKPKSRFMRLLQKPIKNTEDLGMSEQNVRLITTKGGRKYVIKVLGLGVGHWKSQLQANQIARLLGINAPYMEAIKAKDIPQTLREQLNLVVTKDTKLQDTYLVMDYIPNARQLGRPGIIPEKYCKDAYIQAGKTIAFDIFVSNNDRFTYIWLDGECDIGANFGNLIYSNGKLYAIDQDVDGDTDEQLFKDFFNGPPYSEDTEELVTCALFSMYQGDNCPAKKLILDSAAKTAKLIRKKYSQIKEIWPEAPQLPSI